MFRENIVFKGLVLLMRIIVFILYKGAIAIEQCNVLIDDNVVLVLKNNESYFLLL